MGYSTGYPIYVLFQNCLALPTLQLWLLAPYTVPALGPSCLPKPLAVSISLGEKGLWHGLCREHVLQQLWHPSPPNWCGDSSSQHFRTTMKHHPVGYGTWPPHKLTRGAAPHNWKHPHLSPMGWPWSMRDRTPEAAGRQSLPFLPMMDCCEVQWSQRPVCKTT